jgi:hypothetical protein
MKTFPTLNIVLFLIVLALFGWAVLLTPTWTGDIKPTEVETYTKLKPAVVNGKPALPTQVWLDPGAKLDLAVLKDGVLQWSTRPMHPGDLPQSYEVLVGGGSVMFIEQAIAPR